MAVAVVDQREDAAADRHPRRARVPGPLPGLTVNPDLLGLLDVERLVALDDLERQRAAGNDMLSLFDRRGLWFGQVAKEAEGHG